MGFPKQKTNYIVRDKKICGGQPRIINTRIKVQHIAIEYDRLGWSPDQICDAHPELTLAQIHSAISYYYDNKKEIDKAINEDIQYAEKVKATLGR